MYDAFARYYDALMNDVDYGAWSDYLLSLLVERLGPNRPQAPQKILDAACGTGNLALPLARAGYWLTASDQSEAMLRIAQEKARRAGQGIAFIRQSLQQIELPRPVDCINCACDGVNYLTADEDVNRFFAAAWRNLKPGGLLLFDISSSCKLTHVLSGRCYGEDREDLAYLWQNDFDEDKGLLQMDLTIFAREERGKNFLRYRESHFQRAYDSEELVDKLTKTGFDDVHVYAFPSREKPNGAEERIQFVARKSAER